MPDARATDRLPATGVAAGGGHEPGADSSVPVRRASTVMLLRDGAAGLEVFTFERVTGMPFAPGMTVFPGGGLDAGDGDVTMPCAGSAPDWWAERWGMTTDLARAHLAAAVRELFEETGVLLAHPAAGSPEPTAGGSPANSGVSGRSGRRGSFDWAAARADLVAHRAGLAAVLTAADAALRPELLVPWARWVTPPGMPRRYDTCFFAATLPPGQTPDHATTEAVAGGWVRPAQVLQRAAAGDVLMMPPTVAVLEDLARLPTAAAAMAATPSLAAITPELVSTDGSVRIIRAQGREYRVRFRR